MTAFVIIFSLVITALLAGLVAAMPALTPPGISLGVRVPAAHQDDAVVRSSIRRFRLAQLGVWAVVALATLVLAFTLPIVAAALPVLLFVVLSGVSYVIARAPIARAKRDGDWFAGVPVRLVAEITAPRPHRPPLVWPAAALAVLAAATAVGVSVYPSLPEQVATHFRFDGTPDETAAKSVWSVFGALIIAALTVALLTVLSAVAARSSVRPSGGDSPETSAARARRQRSVLAALLSQLTVVIALGLSSLQVAQWLLPKPAAAITGAALGMIALLVIVLAFNVTRLTAVQRIDAPGDDDAPSPQARAEAPDDDRQWRGGIFYMNRSDPAMLVPKRFGVGWTINLGSPGGAAIGILILLVLVAAIVAGVVVALAR
jgi:uncharacterized membrane protein